MIKVVLTITQMDSFFWCKTVHFRLPIYVHKYFCSDNSVVSQNKIEHFQDKAVDKSSKGLHLISNKVADQQYGIIRYYSFHTYK